jgi:cleavage and polyadenylation specificity factor subunit 1
LTNPYNPEIHIDPQQRCAILHFYADKLAVLPFRQSEMIGIAGGQMDGIGEDEDDQSR